LKLIALVALSVALCLSAPAVIAAENDNRFAAADAAFMERGDVARANQALALYRVAYAENPADPEACWRLSMACYFVGFELADNNDQKKKLFAEGRDAGMACLKISSSSAPGHFWTAVNMALYGQVVGPFKMLFTLPAIVSHLNDSTSIDPAYAYGGAYRVLGAISQNLPYILGGRNEDARRYYEKAIMASPDEPMNYLFLARLLADRLKDREAALAVAEKGLTLCDSISPDRYESLKALAYLKDFLTLSPPGRGQGEGKF